MDQNETLFAAFARMRKLGWQPGFGVTPKQSEAALAQKFAAVFRAEEQHGGRYALGANPEQHAAAHIYCIEATRTLAGGQLEVAAALMRLALAEIEAA